VTEIIVRVNNVTIEFCREGKRFKAVEDVSFSIKQGEILTLIGESGSGKSTIGKAIIGINKPSSGEVYYKEENIFSPSFHWTIEKRALVQIILQDPYASFNPLRTIFQQLADPLLHHKQCKASDVKREVAKLLEMVTLTPPEYFMEKYPFQLSGGQLQRVSIARSTILKPKLIIADEPVSAVDASLKLSILELMKKLNQSSNVSFLYITHDLATARYFTGNGRILVMYRGRIVEEGLVEKIVKNPLHPYLKALISAIPVPDPKEAKKKREINIKDTEEKEMPELTATSCNFLSRCVYSKEICTTMLPQLVEVEPVHRVACHLVKKEERIE